MMDLPFDGAISRHFRETTDPAVRAAIEGKGKKAILNPTYPYAQEWSRKAYEAEIAALQIELARLQAWVKDTGQRVAIVFEGRDAAGKGGTIKRFGKNLNPRGARVVALSKPTETEAAQWYFQRYIAHLPAAGEIVFFDRSWYNRGVVEQVFGFCTPEQRSAWFGQVPDFEKMLVDDGIHLFKIWLTIGQATQLDRFLDRESDPLRQWKLSRIDVEGLSRWDAYTTAIEETLPRTHTAHAPWTVIRGDDKRRARVAAIRAVLSQLGYMRKDLAVAAPPDPSITGGPEMLHG
jgi:polyphosphate kinase 2